jgi:hypothetical protein
MTVPTSTDTTSTDTTTGTGGRTRRVATAATWVAVGAVAATAFTGVAFAANGSGPATAGTSVASADQAGSNAGAAGRRAGGLRHVLHGTFTVQGQSGPTTMTVQRGTITAASATSVTVTSSDGFAATYVISSSTVVKRDRTTVTGDKLVVGEAAVVRASAGTASVVRDLSPDAVAKIRDRVGQAGTPAAPTPSSTS